MGWRDHAKIVQDAGHNRHNEHNSRDDEPIVPNVPIVPGLPSETSARATLRYWHGRLSALDFDTAPDGIDMRRWRQLCGDSWWIYENFAARAVRDGWSGHDLFGVLPWHTGWGGLCDRLQGARNLKMAGPKAIWSNWGVADWTCAGAGDQLITSGLVLIWEIHA